ncbi:2-isopropylmalate synthase [Acaryochloris thomasi RCC1774]|uniref:2-isopropylmalate synthase n=1 Tax=Acaryochloris thomasi RCC1774 TaxID=1764569 RepID=A0A2W1JKU3_9CYAN|nr:2-isopropylmalate synthase [Acaryochloris thomasi]PZD72075.1 2-isopropylmalate synthase [Acaryochloris thomasi RCC1774]
MTASPSKITIFDTTLRDGERMPGVRMTLYQKVQIAELLEKMQIDVIEAGYPGAFRKDFDELLMVSKRIKQTAICGLAGSKPDEVIDVALALRSAARGRIHVYTPVQQKAIFNRSALLELIRQTLVLARNYSFDIEWSAFNALKSEPEFLCCAVETAIEGGATTINIPDTAGVAEPESFAGLIALLKRQVPNIDQVTLSVHCRDDRGLAVENSLAAIQAGARQVGCSIKGLGVRKGNADLGGILDAIAKHPDYYTNVKTDLLEQAAEQVTNIMSGRI